MVEFITGIVAVAILAIGAAVTASSISGRQNQRARVLVPVRVRSRRN